MRVLLDVSAVPERPVGAGVYTIAIATGVARRPDVELHLCARTGDVDRWTAIAPAAVVHEVAPTRRPVRLAWEQLRAPRIAAAARADVWHGPHYTLPLRLRMPSVVTVHDLTFFDHPEWHERSKVAYFRRMIRAAVAHADIVICVSEHTAARLRERAMPRGDIVVVPHGVDHAQFRPAAVEKSIDIDADADAAVLATHGVEPPYIAFSGTLEPRKDVPALVRAFARVAPEHPQLRLVLAGSDGWGTAAVRDAIANSGVATRIVRTGYLDTPTIASLFRRAAVVAYPSLEEGFGLPALEALACGAPLVTTTGSSMNEVVGDAALLVRPGDDAQLAHAVRELLTDHRLAARLRSAGPARANTFTWERSVCAHVDAYRRAR